MVHLHSFEREVNFDVSNVLRDAPPLPPPRLPPTETSQVQEENTSRGEHWFKGRISRGKAEELLKDEGDYLFRFKGHDSNTIVLSHCIGNEEFRHVIVLEEKESSCEEIRYEGTTAIHQRILDFAKSAGLSFQDDEPIRLGGASVKAVNPYATYSDIIARNDDKLFKPRQGARKGDTEDTYEELHEPYLTATPLLTTSSSVDYGGYEVVVAPENCKCTEESKEIDSLYNYIKETFDASTLEVLRFLREHGHKCVSDDIHSDVADHLVEAKWDEFGKLLKVPANIRHRIQKSSEDICERTVSLLKAWHQRLGNGATLGILVDALVKVELNEISMLLEDLCETVRLCDSPHDQE
ncbi:uncharacterized protein [Apostichopus japonicus]|uniref:uncharacterized protein isoform X2 n=1 Tax=Stichopus japonicus TaxID=307972 RepID=UPI003AB39482